MTVEASIRKRFQMAGWPVFGIASMRSAER
jgi:hypothetical protein